MILRVLGHSRTRARACGSTLWRGQRSSLFFTPAYRMDVGTAAVTPGPTQEDTHQTQTHRPAQVGRRPHQ